MGLDPFEEPKKKSGGLPLALANLGGVPAAQATGDTPWPALMEAMVGTPGGMAGAGTPSGAEAGGGFGGGFGGYSGMTGPYGSSIASAIGLGNLGMKALGTFGPMLGIGALAPMGLAAAPLGYVSLANRLATMFGVQPSWGFEAPDYQSIRDYMGAFEADEAGRRTAADWSATVDEANARATQNQAELSARGPSGSPDATTSDPDSSGKSAQGDSGQQGMYAKGGAKVFTKPTRPLVGEAGQELGIFIKPEMFAPGMQGNERQVRHALMRAMLGLR